MLATLNSGAGPFSLTLVKDITSGAPTVKRIDLNASFMGVAFSPDSKRVLTGSTDGAARLWDVDYHDTIRYLCARLVRDFTADERAQYGISKDGPTC